ncbi:unnamed protein product [Penicillium roqueforti FM164]|uniref:Genomic scaffold, ProqFM164S02 n=1 Tax=Penicillium roqueforti (strain FM164) TaxID=1365484 RepID=W6Q2D5_PENRF|nr:unnamed protein product [Penicillium roqueforti FM164]
MCSPYTNQANNFVPRMAQNGHLKSSTSYSSPSIADTLRCGPIPEERWCHRRSAKKVSLQGKAIGMDGEEHAELVHGNTEKAGACNVSFTEVSITFIPLPDSSTDCTISNCISRLLRPGCRVAISDILARKELIQEVVNSLCHAYFEIYCQDFK